MVTPAPRKKLPTAEIIAHTYASLPRPYGAVGVGVAAARAQPDEEQALVHHVRRRVHALREHRVRARRRERAELGAHHDQIPRERGHDRAVARHARARRRARRAGRGSRAAAG